jgi:hypothetical protein
MCFIVSVMLKKIADTYLKRWNAVYMAPYYSYHCCWDACLTHGVKMLMFCTSMRIMGRLKFDMHPVFFYPREDDGHTPEGSRNVDLPV